MPTIVYDAEGAEVELPVDSIDDIATMQEGATKAAEALAEANKKVEELEGDEDWKGLREAKNKAQERTKELEALMKEKGVDESGGEMTPEKIAEITQSTLDKNKAEEVSSQRAEILEKLSRGDEQKSKAIEEKFKEITGDKPITSSKVMAQKMTEASIIINSIKDGKSSDEPFAGMNNSPGMGGAPVRKVEGGDRDKAIANAKAMGYQFKSKDLQEHNN